MKLLLVRRRGAGPTDEIYVSVPLRPLVAQRKVGLETLEFGSRLHRAGEFLPRLRNCTHVVVSRYCPRSWVKTLLEDPDRPFQICYLVDDDIPAASKSNTLPLGYRMRMESVARREFSDFLRRADVVIMTSKYLAEKYRAENVTLLQPPNIWPRNSLDHFDQPGSVVISFHATAIHQADLAAIAPALKHIHDMRQNVRLEILTDGRVPPLLRRLPRCRVRQGLSWAEYRKFLPHFQSHIGLAPLMDSPFNRGKSHVKFFDITGMGAIGVYSNRSPYADVIQNGINGILVDDDVAAWTSVLTGLIDNIQQAKGMVESAQARVADIGNPNRLERYWAEMLGIDGT